MPAADNSMLSCEGLTKAFGGNVVVSNVSLDFRAGEIHTIIGPNGAGKTTFFNVLSGDLPPTAGRVSYKGEDITRLAPFQIARKGIGRSYQITSIFPALTVYQNVWAAAYRVSEGAIPSLFALCESHDKVAAKTAFILDEIGLNRVAATKAGELSYGEQRLVEIGIALAGEPSLLLLDEPMSGLSGEESREMGDFIAGLASRYTVVMIEHKIDIVMKVSNTVSVLNFGELIATGRPDEIAGNATVQKAYMGQ